jgi:hypothetical protein
MAADFTGYVTRYGVKCTDGRTILAHAFQACDGAQIPMVWQHQHSEPTNILGHMVLKHMDDGVRCEAFFNNTPPGQQARALVIHKDITHLSIYANGLVQRGQDVLHGSIKEGSLVLAGANPGAYIDNVNIEHSDGTLEPVDDEVIIYSGIALELVSDSVPVLQQSDAPAALPTVPPVITANLPVPVISHAVDVTSAIGNGQSMSDPTVQQVIDSMSQVQRDVVFALIGAMQQDDSTQTITQSQEGGNAPVTGNVFDQSASDQRPGSIISHDDMRGILEDARKGGSLKDAVESYALAHSITAIDLMFPDARAVTDTPSWISRRQDWVAGVLSGTHHTPFSRIKNLFADITLDEARARGYVKGAMKREEFFGITRRVTTPQTVYKKQKLDRDDILDITDFEIVAWLKAEMRKMLDEEVARAVLIGDGRDVADPDKINEANIRPLLTDNAVYVTNVSIAPSSFDSPGEDGIVDGVMTAMQYFQGTGQPTFFTARSWITKMLLAKDTLGRRLHATTTELADAMGVGSVVPVDVFETMKGTLIGIIVNLADYTIGSDRGGEVNFFDDFDIDYNKFTYLYETRLSGALTVYKSAIVVNIFSGAGGVLNDPTAPTFVKATGVTTIPTMANVTYVSVNDTTGVESGNLTAGAQTAIAAGQSIHIRAKAAATYTFGNNAASDWTFQRPAP